MKGPFDKKVVKEPLDFRLFSVCLLLASGTISSGQAPFDTWKSKSPANVSLEEIQARHEKWVQNAQQEEAREVREPGMMLQALFIVSGEINKEAESGDEPFVIFPFNVHKFLQGTLTRCLFNEQIACRESIRDQIKRYLAEHSAGDIKAFSPPYTRSYVEAVLLSY